jgi:transcriptional regulator with XRE-family HTH domain
MVTPVLSSSPVAHARKPTENPPPSRLRTLRIRKGLTQAELADRAGMHRNSIKNIEGGTTREVTAENAGALAKALETTVDELGVRVRSAGPAPSIRMRQLTADQRAVVQEILDLPPEQFEFIRAAMRALRESRGIPEKKSRRRRK